MAPPSQQQRTSALRNRLSDVCSILAYGVGAYPLDRVGLLEWMGGGQFRKLAYLATGAMGLTTVVTCLTQHEKPEMQEVDNRRIGLIGRVREMQRNISKVPAPIRRVCYGSLHLNLPSSLIESSPPIVVRFLSSNIQLDGPISLPHVQVGY